jgi:hypothetical protein
MDQVVLGPSSVVLASATDDLIANSPEQIVVALENMVCEAKSARVLPMVATIPPQRPGGPRDRVAKRRSPRKQQGLFAACFRLGNAPPARD